MLRIGWTLTTCCWRLKRKKKKCSKDFLLPVILLSIKYNMQLYIDLVVLVGLNTNIIENHIDRYCIFLALFIKKATIKFICNKIVNHSFLLKKLLLIFFIPVNFHWLIIVLGMATLLFPITAESDHIIFCDISKITEKESNLWLLSKYTKIYNLVFHV